MWYKILKKKHEDFCFHTKICHFILFDLYYILRLKLYQFLKLCYILELLKNKTNEQFNLVCNHLSSLLEELCSIGDVNFSSSASNTGILSNIAVKNIKMKTYKNCVFTN